VSRLPGSAEPLTLRCSADTFRELSWSNLDRSFGIWAEEGPFGPNEELTTEAFYQMWTLIMKEISDILTCWTSSMGGWEGFSII
jgi:hypothetical protein